MTDEKKAPPPASGENPIIAADKAEDERKSIIETVRKLEEENAILENRLRTNSKEKSREVNQENQSLKAEFTQLETELFALLPKQKVPLDAVCFSTKLDSIKKAAIDYCTERKLDHELWKNLESL